jgi:predicted metal-dependent phosphotriesterase family hydrolase
VAAVRAAGVSQADIDKMMKRNPARLLGLAE